MRDIYTIWKENDELPKKVKHVHVPVWGEEVG